MCQATFSIRWRHKLLASSVPRQGSECLNSTHGRKSRLKRHNILLALQFITMCSTCTVGSLSECDVVRTREKRCQFVSTVRKRCHCSIKLYCPYTLNAMCDAVVNLKSAKPRRVLHTYNLNRVSQVFIWLILQVAQIAHVMDQLDVLARLLLIAPNRL